MMSSPHGDPQSLDINDDFLFETPGFPANINNCEAILNWPIFSDCAPRVEPLVLGPNNQYVVTEAHPIALSRGIQEEQIVPLAEKFLTHVHIKNPILDISEFTRYVRDTAENGLRWDGPSCLVVSSPVADELIVLNSCAKYHPPY